MARFHPLAATFAMALSLSLAAPAFSAPNIVILIADDMGWGDVGYHGSEIRTPELDRLAAEGMRLERFYVYPVCSPTRSALLTGRSSLETGMLGPSNPWYAHGLAADEKLLPEYFQEAGYRTHAVGKWHMGPNEDHYHPMNRGFDSFYGHLHGFLNYEMHTAYGRVDWQRDGETVLEPGYTTRLIAAEAVRLIEERDAAAPLLLYVSFNAPHSPLQAPEETIAEYAHIADEHRRIYAAMVTEMDRGIARITAALEDAQIAGNTLLMFFSDNGGSLVLGANNGALRGGKASPFEGGIRVPALLHWPTRLEPGSVFGERITVTDLLPTLLEAADASVEAPKPLDGRSFWSAIADGAAPPPGEATVLSHFTGGLLRYAYFKDQWKLVQARDGTGGVKYLLFDILDDPYERNDLAEARPELLGELAAELEAMPKAEPLSLHEQPPDLSAPGAPSAPEPDNRAPTAAPYTESGPVPYPPGNFVDT